MAKQTINIGTRANDASGDTIRDAFDKVNDNFNEIYAEIGNPTTDLKFTGATISTDNTNQNLTLDPNGTGVVNVTGDLTVTGTITGNLQINNALTFVGDDSTGSALSTGETFKIAGGNNITTAVSGDTLTITGSKSINVFEITSDDSSAVTVRDNLIVTGSISGQSALQIGSDVNVAQNLTFTSGGSVDRILDEDTMSSDSATALATQQSIKAYVDSQIGATNTLTIADDSSTTSAINLDNTLQVVGATGISTAVSGSTLTITGPNLSSYATISYVDSQNQSQAITFVGDDSTGTAVNSGETFKVAGTQNITTAVSGDTLTITGPDLSSYLTSETSHADVLVDGDFGSAGIMATNGSGTYSIVTDNSSNWNTAYGWGDHASAGYLTSTGTQNIDNLSFNDNIISTSSNADLNLDPGGTGSVVVGAPLYIQKGYVESINTLTSSSTISVDCSLASVHKVTLAENTGFVINNLPSGGTVTLIITQDGGGSNTATFGTESSTAVKFAGGTPTLSTAGGAIDVVTIFNDGVNYLGNIAKAYA